MFCCVRNDKDKKEELDTPGVYKIPMERGTETTAYIGCTQKAITQRIGQHKDNVKSKSCATALANGVINEGWIPLWDKVEVLTKPRTWTRSVLGEYIEMRNKRKELINEPEYSERWEGWRKAAGFHC